MKPVSVAIVLGTRPEAIKMAPVYQQLASDVAFRVVLIVTAQHREMLDQALSVFGISPDVDLNLMRPNQELGEVSGRIVTEVGRALRQSAPDAVLVHGDTTTCLFSSIAAFYERIPVGHIESGLRTSDFCAPWPEEMNRRLTDPLCRWCFAPTPRAAANLKAEAIPEENIFITGNTAVDALLIARDLVRKQKPEIKGLDWSSLAGRRLVLVTGHRRESFGPPLEEFCLALRELVETHEDIVVLYPVHLNPNVQEPVCRILGSVKRVLLIPPVGYLAFVYLMDKSHFIITDSGGIQEEAPSLNKPVLVTRTTTERPEAIQAGMARLVGTVRQQIVSEASRLLSDNRAYSKMASGTNPYGDGRAAERIVAVLKECLTSI